MPLRFGLDMDAAYELQLELHLARAEFSAAHNLAPPILLAQSHAPGASYGGCSSTTCIRALLWMKHHVVAQPCAFSIDGGPLACLLTTGHVVCMLVQR